MKVAEFPKLASNMVAYLFNLYINKQDTKYLSTSGTLVLAHWIES